MPARIGWVGLLASVALVLGASCTARTTPRPLVFAHRGDTTAAPENTVAAIRAATAWADGVEFDVHWAPDGTWRLSHDDLPPDWHSLPQLPDAVAAAGDLLIDIDLKEPSNAAHRRLAEWIVAAGIADRTTVNVKSIDGARLVASIAPGTTIEAQPDWISQALSAPDIDIVSVWGDEWRTALESRPASEVGLFVNSLAEPGGDRWAEAVAAGIGRYYADGPPHDQPG
jgi:glycerophosphoryl diester phosphodiesterase